MLINELDLTITSVFSGWKDISLCSQPRADNSRMMGLVDNGRLPSGANASASLGKTSTQMASIQCSVEKQGKITHLSGFHL